MDCGISVDDVKRILDVKEVSKGPAVVVEDGLDLRKEGNKQAIVDLHQLTSKGTKPWIQVSLLRRLY